MKTYWQFFVGAILLMVAGMAEAATLNVCVRPNGRLYTTRRHCRLVHKPVAKVITIPQANALYSPRTLEGTFTTQVISYDTIAVDAVGTVVGSPVQSNVCEEGTDGFKTVYNQELDVFFDVILNGDTTYGSVMSADRKEATVYFESADCTGSPFISPSDGWSVVLGDTNINSLALYIPLDHTVVGLGGDCSLMNTLVVRSHIDSISAQCVPHESSLTVCGSRAQFWANTCGPPDDPQCVGNCICQEVTPCIRPCPVPAPYVLPITFTSVP